MHSRGLNDGTFPPPNPPVIMAYMGKLPPKGVLFGFRSMKGRDLPTSSI